MKATGEMTPCIKSANHKTDCKACDLHNTCPVYSAPPADIPLMTNKEWIQSLSKRNLAETIHAFHLGYSPWCDHHCAEYADDGCENCIAAWLDLPTTESAVSPHSCGTAANGADIVQCSGKHISAIKRGDKILLLGHMYVAHTDATQDTCHPQREWHVEVQSLENGLYECLYESTFMHGMATILAE